MQDSGGDRAGLSASLVESLSVPKTSNGRIQVDPTLAAARSTRIWALGDCAAVPAPDGGLAPPTAQHAVRQAQVIAWNIVAALRGGATKTYAFRGLGKMGSLGRRSAVADVLGVKMRGFLAWFLWRTIYLFKMPGWGRRLKVAVSWALDLLLPPELVQLPPGGSLGVVREHFEPGQEVFRQGDVGDRVYIVLSGEAEVVREFNGFQRPIATLGRGEYFGEMALLRSTTRNATVRCVEAMDVLSLPSEIQPALGESPAASPGVPEDQRRARCRLRAPREQKRRDLGVIGTEPPVTCSPRSRLRPSPGAAAPTTARHRFAGPHVAQLVGSREDPATGRLEERVESRSDHQRSSRVERTNHCASVRRGRLLIEVVPWASGFASGSYGPCSS